MRGLLVLVSVLLAVACTSDGADSDRPDGKQSTASSTPTESVDASATAAPSVAPTLATSPTAEPGAAPLVSPERRSPDGDLVAYAEFTFARCPTNCAVVFERTDGIEVMRVPFDAPALARIASAWVGYTIDAWLDDGSGVVLGGSCECDGDSSQPVVLVMVDGTVIDSGVSALMGSTGAHVAPNGRYLLSRQPTEAAWGAGVGCVIYGSAQVVELATGDVVAEIEDDGTALVAWDWLDGLNLAYARRALPDPEDGTCERQLLEWQARPVDWSLLTIIPVQSQ